jgi:hypothetical protein
MYCPRCGTSSAGDQNFCRSCGLSLAKVTKALETEFATDELEPSADDAARRAMRRAFTVLPWALLFIFAGLMLVVVGNDITHDKMVSAVGTIVLLLGVVGTVVPFVHPDIVAPAKSRKKKSKEAARPLPDAERAALPAEPLSVDMPSVTEVTTRKLAERDSPQRTR